MPSIEVKKYRENRSMFSGVKEPPWCTKITPEKRKYIFRRVAEGATAKEIAKEVGIHFAAIERAIEYGEIFVKNISRAYRCKQCGCQVRTDPCLACALKGKVEA
jgi:DNA invertase Pin-like site-specific DNA recombinase